MKMKHVVLIGDSLRRHYQPAVAAALAGEAELRGPAENCGSSRHVREMLQVWLSGHDPDIIHLNCGLHDLRYDPGSSAPMVSPAEYADNLEHVFAALKSIGRGQIIWASSTPIDERRHQAARASRRYAADVEAYNAIARGVANRYGAEFNDLYSAVVEAGPEALLKDDGVHFTEAGYRFLAHQVVSAIRPMLRAESL